MAHGVEVNKNRRASEVHESTVGYHVAHSSIDDDVKIKDTKR